MIDRKQMKRSLSVVSSCKERVQVGKQGTDVEPSGLYGEEGEFGKMWLAETTGQNPGGDRAVWQNTADLLRPLQHRV